MNPVICRVCGSGHTQKIGKLLDTSQFAGRRIETTLPGGHLYLCLDCEFKFRYPVQTQEFYNHLYDNGVAEVWSIADTRKDWKLVLDVIMETKRSGGSVLDYGCHSGGLLRQLDNRFSRHGIEISASAAEHARRHNATIWRSLDDMPSEARFDVITVIDVLEHLEHPEPLLTRLFEKLTEKGILIVSTGDAGNRLWNFFGANWWYCYYPEHISFLSESSMSFICRKNNHKIMRFQRFTLVASGFRRRIFAIAMTLGYGYLPRLCVSLLATALRVRSQRYRAISLGRGAGADHFLAIIVRQDTRNVN